jgi:hypothetical protein
MISGFLDRCIAAWAVLQGRVRIERDALRCDRQHVEAGCVTVNKGDLDKLQANAKELVAARAAIAVLEKGPQYKAAVKESGL